MLCIVTGFRLTARGPLEASGKVKEGDRLVAVRGVKTAGREGGQQGRGEEGFRRGVEMIGRLKPADFPVTLSFERGREGGREGGKAVFDLVIQNPPLTRWGVVFGPSPPTEEEEKKENEEVGKEELGGGRQGGREGGREVWPVVRAFQRLPGPAQRSGKIKTGMVLLQINEEDVLEGVTEGGVVERVRRTTLPCSVMVRDMEVWTRMMAWRP